MGKDQELLEAARNGNVPVVEKILGQRAKRSGPLASLRRGPGANVQDTSGYSALHHAALNGHKEIVKLLLEHEASPNLVDGKGCSPLHLAAWTGNAHVVRLLLCHGPSVPNVNLTNKDRETALHCSSQYGHTEVVNLLLEHGCDPTIRNIRQESALDLAAQYGRLETVETLVRTHPELIAAYSSRLPAGVTPLQHTPLHLASRNGHKMVVELLLGSGMEVNIRTGGGSALHEAALCGKLEVARTLLHSGIDLTIRDARNNTVSDLLQQFPPHVVQDITAVIRRHKLVTGEASDGEEALPPIPVVGGLGSPYENVRLRASPPSSPEHWHADRRVSATSALSVGSEDVYEICDIRHQPWSNSCGLSKSVMEGSFLSEDSCCSQGRDPDQISISSTSSMGGTSSRERRSADIYLPMTPSPGSNNKVSPTPPKKPPRRNLSVSPTHLTPFVSSEGSVGSYEYLFLARSGARSQGDLVPRSTSSKEPLRRGKSADQYVDMKPRYSITATEFSMDDQPDYQPIAITSVYENIPFKTTNPKRKLRRLQTEKGFENYDPSIVLSRGDLPFKKVEPGFRPLVAERLRIVDAEMLLAGSRESLLNGSRHNGEHKPNLACPLSPTNYQQPPTPDHPPPSATQAENSIHERIRPLSEEYCNMMKRRSRDMETETEEELLLLVYPVSTASTAASTGSLSSATDNNAVEEFVGDVPFAGLFKGSTSGTEKKAERPKTLRRLQNVYENMREAAPEEATKEQEKPSAVLSPLDEQEEWAKISEIMASFGTGLVRESVFVTELEKEFQARLGLNFTESSSSNDKTTSVGQWLQNLNLPQYESTFINYGYDKLDFINGVLDDADLKDMGVASEEERQKILESLESLPKRVVEAYLDPVNNNNNNQDKEKGDEDNEWSSVDRWLTRLELGAYCDTFRRHLYTDMDRVTNVWEVELTAVLEIAKPGHRHRILASLPYRANQPTIQDINADLTQLKSSIQDLEGKTRGGSAVTIVGGSSGSGGGTGTLRHSHKKSRPAPQPPAPELQIRDPSQLLVGVPSTLTAQWRHTPYALVTGHLTYLAQYLGSTVVKELRGTESTKKSIQKLKKPQAELKPSPDIYLSISYRGVKFLSADTKELVCEHEIRNIHCACQDAEDLTHFAYITKDHASMSHYCHVFCVQTMDQATEIILTLGQAFEVAYQMVLREGQSSGRGANGHTRSHSANQIMEPAVRGAVTRQPQSTHSRSHSANGQVRLEGACAITNGHPHPPTPPAPPKTPLLLAEEHV